MKNTTTVSITLPAEKLSAVQRYMAKKSLSFDIAMQEAAAKLYEKYVPGNVREYIEERDKPTPFLKATKPGNASASE